MKTTLGNLLLRAGIVAGIFFWATSSMAQLAPLADGCPSYTPLDTWSFYGTTNWTSDSGFPPVSFTNLASSYLGNGSSLVVDSTNAAWLQFNVVETNAATNLTVNTGSVIFWFAPSSWSSVDAGGTGPGEYGRLLEAGGYTPDSSFGWWSLYVDDVGNNIYFSAQTNDFSSNVTTYLSAPIAWTSNYFHFVALTYSATNTALYLDGALTTNGPPMTIYPGPDALANGFFIGSDSNGVLQARGLFNTVETFNIPLDADTISQAYAWFFNYYLMDPLNRAMWGSPTPLTVNYTPSTNDLWLQYASWSNVISSLVIHVPWDVGGSNFIYDVYATTNLLPNVPGLNGTNWMLVTQSAPGQTNLVLPPIPGAQVAFYKLGTMQDSDGDGLPDAYELLVSHSNPNLWDSNGNGIGDGDEISPSGLPWRLEYARKWSAVIYANTPVATQGGGCGQCTVYLPSPAPTGGTTVQYYLGGTAAPNSDYTLTPSASQLVIPAGSSSGTINVCASSGSTYSAINLYADITLTNATSCPVDGDSARVNIVDSGLPSIRVYALPPWIRRPSSTFGTNMAGFYFIRGGSSTNALTITVSTAGSTASSGSDYTAFSTTVSFAANVRTNWLPLTITPSSTITASKTLVVAITSAPGYQIDPTNGSATMTIAATASPTLPVVQISATVPDATTTTPGQFTFTRSFSTSSALRVFYHAWGSTNNVVASTNGQDTTIYSALPGYVDIPANASTATVSLTVTHPQATVQTVTFVLAAGDYSIGASNMDTVYIDGSGPLGAAAYVTRNGIFSASVNQAANIQIIRYGSALSAATINWNMANPFGPPFIQGLHSGQYTWAVRQSVMNVQISPQWTTWPDSSETPQLSLSNSWVNSTIPVTYEPPENLFTVAGPYSPATIVSKGSSSYVTVGHAHPNGNPTTVYLTLSGSAANGTDFSLGTTVTLAGYQGATNVPFTAFNNAPASGWKTAVVSINTGLSQVPENGLDYTFVRIQDPQNAISDTDLDGDGLPDGYELNNGLDPLTPDNPYIDADHDGLGLAEELELGTNPNTPDAPPVYPSIDDNDYLPLTLHLGASGKMLVEPSQSCSVCHEATLRVGGFIRTSPRTDWSHNPAVADYLIRFLRGTNYPIQVTCDPYYSSLLTSNAAAATTSPKYTAAYIAQFLLGNGIYPFITDANHLLGTNQMVQEVLPKTATLYIPDMTIAADVDRNGNIDFKNRNDRTATNNQFIFWINDDADSGSDDTANDLDPTPSVNPPNSSSTTINGLRDLEDFARLQFKIDGLPQQFMTNGNYQIKLYLTNQLGNPSIRLFPAADANGGLGYLTNTTTGNTQIAKVMLGVVSNNAPLTIASSAWQTAGQNSFFLPTIFEGISTGQCVITFGFSTNNGPPVAVSRPFYLTLRRVTDLYEHWTVGDNTNADWSTIPDIATNTLDSGHYGPPQKPEDFDDIVFVHGWRMPPWERRAFASTAYKRMWQLGYKGRFVLYSWPTDYTALSFWDLTVRANWQNYDRSEQRSWKSALGLSKLLLILNESAPPNCVRLIAHSMGNITASEALRLGSIDSYKAPLVQSYIASQAASVAYAYDATNPAFYWLGAVSRTPEIYGHYPRNGATQPYFSGMRNAALNNRIINFNNIQDYALSSLIAWPQNEFFKPDSGWNCMLTSSSPSYTYWQGNTRLLLDGLERHRDQTYNIFANISQAESKALGCAEDNSHHTQGEIGGAVDLHLAPFAYGNNSYEHSAQFNSINMNRRSYWWQVLSTFSLTNNLPKP